MAAKQIAFEQEAREASLKGRRQPRANGDGQQRPPADTVRPSYIVPDPGPQSPWLESLRKNLEELFATQRRVATETSPSVDHLAL